MVTGAAPETLENPLLSAEYESLTVAIAMPVSIKLFTVINCLITYITRSISCTNNYFIRVVTITI